MPIDDDTAPDADMPPAVRPTGGPSVRAEQGQPTHTDARPFLDPPAEPNATVASAAITPGGTAPSRDAETEASEVAQRVADASQRSARDAGRGAHEHEPTDRDTPGRARADETGSGRASRPPRTPIPAPTLATVPNFVLVVAVVAPAVKLIDDGDTAALVTSGIVAALLLFFTFFTRALMRKGAAAAVELYARTMTFWWMLAAFLVAQTTPRPVGFVIVGALCLLAVYEFATMRPEKPGPGDRAALAIAMACAPAVAVLAWFARSHAVTGPHSTLLHPQDWTLAFAALAVPVVAALPMALAYVVVDRTKGVASALGWLVLGTVLCVGLLGHGLLILDIHQGISLLIWCFFLTELRDLLSYWVGKSLAGQERRAPSSGLWRAMNHKIAPTVSPNKAWGAGLVSVLLVVAIGIGMRGILPDLDGHVPALWWVIVASAAIGFLGLFGDLVFSLLKRDAGVKDSGSLLPGGTGVLDRIDSLVLTIPATFHLAFWVYLYHHG